jgi:6-phosphofructokinase
MASGCVDVCLIPEVSFDLYSEHGVLEYVSKLLRRKGHCVICVAEGAGQVRTRRHMHVMHARAHRGGGARRLSRSRLWLSGSELASGAPLA